MTEEKYYPYLDQLTEEIPGMRFPIESLKEFIPARRSFLVENIRQQISASADFKPIPSLQEYRTVHRPGEMFTLSGTVRAKFRDLASTPGVSLEYDRERMTWTLNTEVREGLNLIELRTIPLDRRDFESYPATIVFYGDSDTDVDGLPDSWEKEKLGSLNLGATDDNDDDGLMLKEELFYRTNPTISDTDGDGIPDGEEVVVETDPLDKESFVGIIKAIPAENYPSYSDVNGKMEIHLRGVQGRNYMLYFTRSPELEFPKGYEKLAKICQIETNNYYFDLEHTSEENLSRKNYKLVPVKNRI